VRGLIKISKAHLYFYTARGGQNIKQETIAWIAFLHKFQSLWTNLRNTDDALKAQPKIQPSNGSYIDFPVV